ncbi:hypothetical protein R1flu_003075 [Riccia fluitans]|uniref:Uncharacterized protein n=1 Tax=Riccia fluitans TaxID=41844 RepID=A0ABD1Y850_9MARC
MSKSCVPTTCTGLVGADVMIKERGECPASVPLLSQPPSVHESSYGNSRLPMPRARAILQAIVKVASQFGVHRIPCRFMHRLPG